MKYPVLILFGPTASGKTHLLNRFLNSAKSISAKIVSPEIVSADSMQVYKGMDIGTAKPSKEEREKIPHHLIDIKDPDEQFNAGEFVRLAEKACTEIAGKGSLPIVSGGTGFYIKNLVEGMTNTPPSDINIRNSLIEELALKGASSLMEELQKADPISAARIHINDEYRLLRALEVFRLTGQPLSSFPSPWSKTGNNENTVKKHESPGFYIRGNFRFLLIGLRRNREELYKRINERTSAMFKAGLAEEVKSLYEKNYTPGDPGLRAIGYREFFVENLDKTVKGKDAWHFSIDYEGVEKLIAQNSRRYAKRQITFFSSLPCVNWIDMEEGVAADAAAVSQINKLLEKNPVMMI